MRHDTTVVYLLDLLALPREATAAALNDILACPTLLKVGYGLQQDLAALNTRLGTAQCTDPCMDLRDSYRRVPGGLAGVVAAVLRGSLDKASQCSDWAARPLSTAQRTYAALDAYVLLQLYDAAPPPRQPFIVPTDHPPRFVCDVMLEGLARQLRLCGVDTASAPCACQRHRVHRALVDIAERFFRVLGFRVSF